MLDTGQCPVDMVGVGLHTSNLRYHYKFTLSINKDVLQNTLQLRILCRDTILGTARFILLLCARPSAMLG